MNTKEVIGKIFKDPKTKYELTEFDTFRKSIDDIIEIYPKVMDSGREAGKIKYFVKSFVPFASGKKDAQVFVENGKSCPEEIVRQLWVYKLMHTYGYKVDEIELEKSVYFGSKVGTKAADIIVYTDNTKQTPKIIIEVKKPKRKDGIEQLKSYLNAEGSPVGVWSNGSDSIILYRPYPKDFEDTLYDLPKRGQEPKDVLEARKTLGHLKKSFNFKKIIQDLEELVLADSGKDEFNEIFKLIFAKIWDEKEADENREDKEVEFSKALDPEITHEAKYSEAIVSVRTDAEYFFPAFDTLCLNLPKTINFTPLAKSLTFCQRGKQPLYDVEGVRVINSRHVLTNKINLEGNRLAVSTLADTLKIRYGDVLINGTGRGTIGRTAPYLEDEEALPDNHVTILRTSKIDPVFLSVFLNSKAGQLQVEKHQRGSSGQIELYPFDIRKFLVWEAPQSSQSEIRNLYDKALSLEKESKVLLEKAKHQVEYLIEQAAGET